jgi:hypothetical protein
MKQLEMEFNVDTSWRQAVHVKHDTKWFQATNGYASRRVITFTVSTPNDLIVRYCEDILRSLGDLPQERSFGKITQLGDTKVVMLKSIVDSSD